MRVMFRKAMVGAVVIATAVGGSVGAVKARTLPVSTVQQVAGGAPVEDVGYYYRRRGVGAGFAIGAAALGFGLAAVAASRPYYGYGYGYPAYGYGYGYPVSYGYGGYYGSYYPGRVVYAPRYYRPYYGVRRVVYGPRFAYRRAFYGPRYGYGGYGRGGFRRVVYR